MVDIFILKNNTGDKTDGTKAAQLTPEDSIDKSDDKPDTSVENESSLDVDVNSLRKDLPLYPGVHREPLPMMGEGLLQMECDDTKV